MADDEEQVTPAAEEPAPEQEPENLENPENPEAQPEPENDADKFRKIAEDQRKRAEKAEGELKKLKTTPSPSSSPTDAARMDRIELAAHGIKDRDEQDFVLSAAKRLGVSPSEAASDDIVSAKLDKMRDAKRTKDGTPPPGGSGASTRRSGKLPDFSKMTNAEFDEWTKKNR